MTANEMADLLIQFDSGRVWEHAEEIANTLRQQQAEIAELKHINRNWRISEGMALSEIEALKEQLEDCVCQGGHSEAWLKAKGRLK